MARFFAMVCGAAVLLMLAACESHAPDALLLPAADSPITDVPIPAGFQLEESKSMSRVLPSGVRYVDHQYAGDDSSYQVVKFYKDALPGQGWQNQSQEQVHEVITLKYAKATENLVVTVSSGTLKTHIRVKIDPVAQDAK